MKRKKSPKLLSLYGKCSAGLRRRTIPPEGISSFREILDDSEYINERDFYGAFDGEKMVGVLGRGKTAHINFFFVKKEYHRKGIGRKLFEAMLNDCDEKRITVNASPYAVNIYKHFGFVPTDSEKETKGIKYTPMALDR